MSDYIITYSRIKFYPLNPKIEDININDIAHALSLMTRANGHFKYFYSVAQHSINCYLEAKAKGYSDRIQLGCLLHDASESYISDITRPVKRRLTEYLDIEENLQKLIYEHFGLSDLSNEELKLIEEIDDALLYLEFKELMDVELFKTRPYLAVNHNLSQMSFREVEKDFLNHFNRLTNKEKGLHSVGVDGCRGGWVAVAVSDHDFEINVFNNIEEVVAYHCNSNNILIDIPIGLPESINDIRPDSLVRNVLRGKASSVFGTPSRQAVYADDEEEAKKQNINVLGKSLSKQSYAITKKIREVDEFLNLHSKYKNKLLESHPELCFAMLSTGKPVMENKKTPEGMRKRIDILKKYYNQTEELIKHAKSDVKLKRIMDDIIDALCLAVVGMMCVDNNFKTIPEKPMEDNRGILMQIVYVE